MAAATIDFNVEMPYQNFVLAELVVRSPKNNQNWGRFLLKSGKPLLNAIARQR